MKMKKFFVLAMCAVLAFACVGCGKKDDKKNEVVNQENENKEQENKDDANKEENKDDNKQQENTADVKSEGVMTYAEYMAAEMDTEVVIETYVQAHQSWWDNKITVYSQDKDGAYFLYNMACTEEDAKKLVPGTKIKVTGYKGEWSGEIEVMDATFEIIEGASYIAPVMDITSLLGTDELIKHQNEFVAFKGMTVEAAGKDADGNDVPFLYNWDGSGEKGSDLYFNVSLNGTTYTFTVESYLCGSDTAVYQAVENLKIGDVVDMEGFLYWYEGVNPHITSVTVK